MSDNEISTVTRSHSRDGISGLVNDVLVSDARWQRVQHGQSFDDVEPMLREEMTRPLELVGDGL